MTVALFRLVEPGTWTKVPPPPRAFETRWIVALEDHGSHLLVLEPDRLVPGDVAKVVRTGEMLRFGRVDPDGTVEVQRGIGTAVPSQMIRHDDLLVLPVMGWVPQ